MNRLNQIGRLGKLSSYKPGGSWSSYWASTKGQELKAKMLLWTSPEGEADDYYLDKIGVQDRQASTDGEIAGVIHPGRAIRYDGSKLQYSKVSATPANFRPYNNSITFSTWLRINTTPSGVESVFIGGIRDSKSGAYQLILASNATIYFYLKYTSEGSLVSNFFASSKLEIDKWYHLSQTINKQGNYLVKINDVTVLTVDISSFTFNDNVALFYLGGNLNSTSGIMDLRDTRMFAKALTDSEHTSLFQQDYVAGVTSWWMAEEGKENGEYLLRDCVGTNHLYNSAFTEDSLISGNWKSLFNKFGYSNGFDNGDLILGDGAFSDSSKWSMNATHFAIDSGNLWYKAASVDSLATNLRSLVYSIGEYMTANFDVIEGPATLVLANQSSQLINTQAVYPLGSHSVSFRCLNSGTAIKIKGIFAGGAFRIDNFVISKSEANYISPKMDSAIPSADVIGRDLTFFGQAKFNLQKVDENTVRMPNHLGEAFDACELITSNDWYDENGVGEVIALVNITPFELGRQYYSDDKKELIIIKHDAVLTEAENNKLITYLGITDSFKLSVAWEEDYALIDFVDTSGGVAQHEVEESLNGGEYSLVTTLDAGVTSYENRTWQNALMRFRVRSKIGDEYSDYSSIVSCQTPLVFKLDQSVLKPINIATLISGFQHNIRIDWGDGTSQNIIGTTTPPPRDPPMIIKNYTETGQYWVTISGDTDYITWIHSLTGKDPYEGLPGSPIYGSLAKWRLPSWVYEIEIWWLPLLTPSDISHWFPLPSGTHSINVAYCNFYGELNDPEWPNDFIEIYLARNNFTGSPLGSGIPSGALHIGVDLSENNFTADLSDVALPANLVTMRVSYNEGFTGDLSGQNIPEGINVNAPLYVAAGRIIECQNCNFTKGYRGGFDWVQTYNFQNNLFNSTELDSLLDYIDNYFTGGKVPLSNCVYTLNGTGMGIPTAAGLASKASIEGKYAAAEKTISILVNS